MKQNELDCRDTAPLNDEICHVVTWLKPNKLTTNQDYDF